MKNILFVESGTGGGGSFESMYQYLRVIDRRRYRPVVVYLNHNRFESPMRDLDVPVYVLTDWLYSRHTPTLLNRWMGRFRRRALWLNRWVPFSYVGFLRVAHWTLVRQLTRVIRQERIDLIHLNVHVYRDLFGLFVADSTGIPCISHLRSPDLYSPRGYNSSMARYANHVVSAYIAISDFTLSTWLKNGIDAGKSRIVFNGMPLDCFKPIDVRAEWGLGSDVRFIAACVAPLRSVERVDEFLIRGFAAFIDRFPSAALLVVGEGPMREVLASEAVRLGVDRHVVFTGFGARAKELIASVDVSVSVPDYDSFGRVILETMQARTPLIASDVGGIREIVDDEYNGLLVRHGDEQGLADALERLAKDKKLRANLVENAFRTVNECFSIKRHAAQIEEVYESVLEK